MNRPVARAGVAAAIFTAFTGLFLLAGATFLSAGHVEWLIKPLVGIDMAPLPLDYVGLGTGNLAVSVAFGGLGILGAAWYLDHCVINQPMWSVIGGWGLLLSGLLILTIQQIVSPGRVMFVDIEHLMWPVGLAPAVIGAALILVSWLRAPDFFSPHESRWTLVVLVGALAICDGSANMLGLSSTSRLAFFLVIMAVALIGGSWLIDRLTSMRAGSSDVLPKNGRSASAETGPTRNT
jgi:hypothetical protein